MRIFIALSTTNSRNGARLLLVLLHPRAPRRRLRQHARGELRRQVVRAPHVVQPLAGQDTAGLHGWDYVVTGAEKKKSGLFDVHQEDAELGQKKRKKKVERGYVLGAAGRGQTFGVNQVVDGEHVEHAGDVVVVVKDDDLLVFLVRDDGVDEVRQLSGTGRHELGVRQDRRDLEALLGGSAVVRSRDAGGPA